MFKTKILGPARGRWSGFSSDGELRVGELAEEVLGPTVHGGEAFAYLFRRFGYPNIGWDDHKDLVQYLLATPMPGLGLVVRPYMGSPDADLMFSVMMSDTLNVRYRKTTPRQLQYAEIFKRARAWAGRRFFVESGPGEKSGVMGWAVRERRDGEPASQMKYLNPLRDGDDEHAAALQSATNHLLIQKWIKEHPAEREAMQQRLLASMDAPQREKPGLAGKIAQALAAAMEDLKRPTYVRDVPFNILGRDNLPDWEAEIYAQAGCTAEYIFGPKSRLRKPKAKTAGK